MDELLLTPEERKEIPKGFHYLLEYKEELDCLLNLQLAKDDIWYKKLLKDYKRIKVDRARLIEEAEKRGIDSGITAYESACESRIEEAKRYYEQKIDKLQEKIQTTNVYYLREIQKNKVEYEAKIELAKREERERIHDYITILTKSGDLSVNDGVLLWDIIQDTLPLKYMQVGLVRQALKGGSK